MKIRRYHLLLLLAICTTVEAGQNTDPLFPFVSSRMVGFFDRNGIVWIEPTFGLGVFDDSRPNFQEGLQAVGISNLVGYINRNGDIAISARFGLALPFRDGLAPVRDQNGLWGYIDTNGVYSIEPKYEDAEQFSHGLAQVTIEHKAGFIDRSGHYVVEPQFTTRSHFSNFREGLACVCISNKWGFISTNGTIVIAPRYNGPSEFSGGLAPVEEGERFSNMGYINTTGEYAIPPRFRKAWGFSEGLARVEAERGQMQFIAPSGEVAFTVEQGAWSGEFTEGLVNVCKGQSMSTGQWGYMDRSGNGVIGPDFQQAAPFINGIAAVVLGGQRIYIDKRGKIIWKQERQPLAAAYGLPPAAEP
jgi:hypothetical protein